jgi:hypothetical protein
VARSIVGQRLRVVPTVERAQNSTGAVSLRPETWHHGHGGGFSVSSVSCCVTMSLVTVPREETCRQYIRGVTAQTRPLPEYRQEDADIPAARRAARRSVADHLALGHGLPRRRREGIVVTEPSRPPLIRTSTRKMERFSDRIGATQSRRQITQPQLFHSGALMPMFRRGEPARVIGCRAAALRVISFPFVEAH